MKKIAVYYNLENRKDYNDLFNEIITELNALKINFETSKSKNFFIKNEYISLKISYIESEKDIKKIDKSFINKRVKKSHRDIIKERSKESEEFDTTLQILVDCALEFKNATEGEKEDYG